MRLKYIEVVETNSNIDNTSTAGIYLKPGMLWITSGNGMYPISIPLGQLNIKTRGEDSSNGMNEDFILKLLAIGNKPDSVHKFTGS